MTEPEDPIARYGALFHRDGDEFVPTALARGPWDPNMLHGGAPSALLADALERHDPGTATFVARLTVELLRPAPLAPLTLEARTLRPGKKVQWVEGVLRAGGREVARATALRFRTEDVDVDDAVSPAAEAPPPPESCAELRFDRGDPTRLVGLWAAHDMRLARGIWMQAGPSTAWFRLRCPVVGDDPPSPLARVAACADFGSGIGNPLTFVTASAINADVTLHLHRHPVGEWVALEAGAWAQPHGVGMAETRVHDTEGPIGRAVQSLLV